MGYRWKAIAVLAGFFWFSAAGASSDEINHWREVSAFSRPAFPHAYQPPVKGSVSFANVKRGFEVEQRLADECLPVKGALSWNWIANEVDERIAEARLYPKDGVEWIFSVYTQLENPVPYYWTGAGYGAFRGNDVFHAAEEFVKAEICGHTPDARVSIATNILERGKIKFLKLGGESIEIPFARTIFLFVDDRPGSNWSHPCRYVFLNETLTEFVVSYQMNPPQIGDLTSGQRIRLKRCGGESFPLQTLEQIQNAVYSNAALMASNALSYSGEVSKSHFVLISGGANPESNGIRFWADTAMMYSTLTLKYGVPKSQIHVYVSDGTSSAKDANLADENSPVLVSSPTDLDGDGLVDVDGAATKSNVSGVFSTLRGQLTSSDQLFVFITSHGSPDGTAGAGNYGCAAWLFSTSDQAFFWDTELHDWTKGFSCPVAFAIETCYSGGFIDNITQTANRVIATACHHYESSWGTTYGSGSWGTGGAGQIRAYNDWAKPFISAVRGFVPKSASTSNAYPWQDGPSCDADNNGDGFVSFSEARTYALNNDSSANSGKEHPQYAESTSGLGASFFFVKKSAVVAPVNDNFASATSLSGNSGSKTGSNVGATSQSGEPLVAYRSSATTTVWWKWTAPSSGSAQFDTIGTSFDTVMGIYKGTSLSSLVAVVQDDDGGGSDTSKCVFDCTSGTTYYICVGGYQGKTGSIALNWNVTVPEFVITGGTLTKYNGSGGDVTIPSGVTSIGASAFDDCTALCSIDIPASVKAIGNYAFRNTRLAEVTLREGLQSIGESAFSSCPNLSSVVIPASVTTLGENAFSGCTALRTIVVQSGNAAYSSADGVLYSKDKRVLICYPGGKGAPASIPTSVQTIAKNAFTGCSKLTTVTIPASVSSIGSYAFDCNPQLTAVYFEGNAPTDVGYYIFNSSPNLVSYVHDDSTGWKTAGSSELPDKWQSHPIAYCPTTFEFDASGGSKASATFPNSSGKRWYLNTSTRPSWVTSLCLVTTPGMSVLSLGTSASASVAWTGDAYFSFSAGANTTGAARTWTVTGRNADGNEIKTFKLHQAAGAAVALSSVSISGASSVSSGGTATYVCTATMSDGTTKTVTPTWSIYSGSSYASISSSGKLTASAVISSQSVTVKASYAEGGVTKTATRTVSISPGAASLSSVSISGASSVSSGGTATYVCTATMSDGTTKTVTPTWSIYSGSSYASISSSGRLTASAVISSQSVTVKASYTEGGVTKTATRTVSISPNSSADFEITDGELTKYKGSGGAVTIPSGVTSIGSSAFRGCVGLTSVTIPSSVTVIYAGALEDCSGLASVNVDSANRYYCSIDGVLYNKDATVLIFCPGGARLVTIPSGVTSIAMHAFRGCVGLSSVTIPSSVTSIGDGAFSGCSGLTSINVNSANRYYCSIDGVLYNKDETVLIRCPGGSMSVKIPSGVTSIGSSAFNGCVGLTSVTIPSGVTSIGDFAFEGCVGLTSVTIPSSVKSIGGRAFKGCAGLTSVTIPSSVTSIDDGAFEDCCGLKSIDVNSANKYYCSIDGVLYNKGATKLVCCPGGVRSLTIPSSVTHIGNYAFSCCSGLASVTIPSSVTHIGNYAFSGCSGLTSVMIPTSVMRIGAGAFVGCSGLTSVTIPSGMTAIYVGAGVFEYCSGLTSIDVDPANMYFCSVYGVFYDKEVTWLTWCPGGVRSVTIPSSVTHIGTRAFIGCSELTSVTLPSGVTSIGAKAFLDCSGLTSVTIPSSVTSIARDAFENCGKLTVVYVDQGDGGRVRGLCDWPGSVEFVERTAKPSEPTGVAATDGAYSDRVSVSWTGSSGATSYNLYRSTTETRPDSPMMTDVTSPYDDPAVTPGVEYCYWVEAVNAAGSAVSSCDTGYCAVTLSLGKTTDSFVADGGNGNASVTANTSWSAAADVDWITLTTSSGSGNGALAYCVAASTSAESRAGTITVSAGSGTTCPVTRTVAVTQDGVSAAVATPVISPADGATFDTASCLVTITCATEGATIYYSTNGSSPRLRDQFKYTQPFAIAGTTTVKAVAVKDGFTQSEIATAVISKVDPRPLTLAAALDESKLSAVKTDGDGGWMPVRDASAVGGSSAQSGAIGMKQRTCLRATVYGRGTLSFNWKVSCEADYPGEYTYDHLTFSTVEGGRTNDMAKIDGETEWLPQTATFTTDGPHVVLWIYSTDDWEEPGFEDCGWVDNVMWTGDAPPSDIVIPDMATLPKAEVESFMAKYPSLAAQAGGDAEAFAKLPSAAGKLDANGNQMYVWQDIIAGTDPTNAEDKFKIVDVKFVDGAIKITWSPDLNENGVKNARKYTEYGRKELGGSEEWTNMMNVDPAEKNDYKFRTVTVDLP